MMEVAEGDQHRRQRVAAAEGEVEQPPLQQVAQPEHQRSWHACCSAGRHANHHRAAPRDPVDLGRRSKRGRQRAPRQRHGRHLRGSLTLLWHHPGRRERRARRRHGPDPTGQLRGAGECDRQERERHESGYPDRHPGGSSGGGRQRGLARRGQSMCRGTRHPGSAIALRHHPRVDHHGRRRRGDRIGGRRRSKPRGAHRAQSHRGQRRHRVRRRRHDRRRERRLPRRQQPRPRQRSQRHLGARREGWATHPRAEHDPRQWLERGQRDAVARAPARQQRHHRQRDSLGLRRRPGWRETGDGADAPRDRPPQQPDLRQPARRDRRAGSRRRRRSESHAGRGRRAGRDGEPRMRQSRARISRSGRRRPCFGLARRRSNPGGGVSADRSRPRPAHRADARSERALRGRLLWRVGAPGRR